ncbi:MOSC domain-containing protein [Cellvibrio japonicus]|uniref:MOSC domain protein n=1 Tax=Cellvibrio japonicus (strain Ueda107) TaxID=498211 RepID=B3PCR6_CELJU|nr:MOSC domain-containing protein [Cellvibrio japonicus]ACE85684.1 MOSC domain protein [Cellvibrio japonicus Ueda107]QEI13286.1 MOSC domain-containing protein [Cellvibrio japonicus]QEI16860.1 MOSC domain-containing protein [Cellvibrio japonicus]QEI20438.1 MOSC domain-containing protein [Cellvibrio japonicus]
MNSQARLLDKLCEAIAPGRLEWIGVRTERRGEVMSVASTQAVEGLGLEGDHRMKKTPGSARQVTLISREYIEAICRHTGHNAIDPALLRRNLVISGMNLNVLRYQRLQIGNAILETSALCHPCSRMDEALGAGGAAAMFGYGGLCAKVVQGGIIQVGNAVLRLPALDR